MELKRKEIVGTQRGPHLLITGGVHGDEFEPMAAVRQLMREVAADQLRGRLTLVPVVNEPAYLRGHRTAEDGLDLARTCPGRADGSVTERIAWALSNLIRSVNYYIDLHSGGTTLCVWPLAGYMLHPDAEVRKRQQQMATAFNLPVVWGTDCRLNGRSLSVARDARVPAIYAEYHGSGLCDPSGIRAYMEGCLNVLAVLDMIDRPLPPSRREYLVEDEREGSGHMQVCNPAPVTGFFQPHVQPGSQIDVGAPLGVICDVLGDRPITVPSRQRGIVVVLRTFSFVRESESLAVIMETDRP